MKVLFQFAKRQIAIGLIACLAIPIAQAQSSSSSNPQARQDSPVAQEQDARAESSSANEQQNSPESPVGTAAAPAETPLGVAASKPAGAAIAPAKQRRSRSLLIHVGIIVGACAAVGTVAALSHASPSKPH
jgi:hypothetical protein